jgi:hypothetical protein
VSGGEDEEEALHVVEVVDLVGGARRPVLLQSGPMTGWLRDARLGRALRWRLVSDWPWLSLQLLAFWLTIKIATLLESLSWPARVAVLIPVALVLFGIADVVADRVDARVEAAPASER